MNVTSDQQLETAILETALLYNTLELFCVI